MLRSTLQSEGDDSFKRKYFFDISIEVHRSQATLQNILHLDELLLKNWKKIDQPFLSLH